VRRRLLVCPALQAAVRLPERHRRVVERDIVAGVRELRARVRDELLLARAAADELRPVEQLEAELGEMPHRVLRDAEMDERETLGCAALHLVEGALPRVHVDVGRRRRRKDVPAGLDPDARRVARVERAVAVEVADVMRRMAGRREALKPEHAAADDVDVLLRHGCELAPKRVEAVAVQAACAALQPRGVDEVRGADGGDVHLQ
jgi:hypothetical protein